MPCCRALGSSLVVKLALRGKLVLRDPEQCAEVRFQVMAAGSLPRASEQCPMFGLNMMAVPS